MNTKVLNSEKIIVHRPFVALFSADDDDNGADVSATVARTVKRAFSNKGFCFFGEGDSKKTVRANFSSSSQGENREGILLIDDSWPKIELARYSLTVI